MKVKWVCPFLFKFIYEMLILKIKLWCQGKVNFILHFFLRIEGSFDRTACLSPWMGLALAIALVSRWDVRQWQVPKAGVRIFLGCRVVGMTSLCSSAEASSSSLCFLLESPLSKETISCPREET